MCLINLSILGVKFRYQINVLCFYHIFFQRYLSFLSIRIKHLFFLLGSLLIILIVSCKENQQLIEKNVKRDKMFFLIDSKQSGIEFINTIEETEESNHFQYVYAYNEGG